MAKKFGRKKEYYARQKLKTESNLEKKLTKYVVTHPKDEQAGKALIKRTKIKIFSKK